MVTTRKNDSVENNPAIPEEPQEVDTAQEEVQQDTISDRRMLLGPLIIYGLVAFVIAGIIVTTAIVLNNEYNEIDKQVAAVEAEIAQQNKAEQLAEQETVKPQENITIANAEVTEVVASNDTADSATTPAEVTQPVEAALPAQQAATIPPVVQTPVAPATDVATATVPATDAAIAASQPVYETFDRKARIAERNERIAQQDQEYLEAFKTSQAKQIEWLRAQLVKQQERIEAIEKRNMETYQMREAAIKRMQEAREQSLDRI